MEELGYKPKEVRKDPNEGVGFAGVVESSMPDRGLTIGKRQIRATDSLILATLAFLSLLTILFNRRVEGWWILVLKNLGVATVYVVVNVFSERRTRKHETFILRLVSILFLYAYINLAVEKLQLIIYGHWLDDTVLKMEKSLFGVHPTLWMQQFISKPLTEWMMFAYVVYLPLFPILCSLIYHRRGEFATEDYFFTLGLVNIICDLGFILFPVAGPVPFMGVQYTVPLEGYIWTWLGEALRHHAQFVGGTIPSPHCANATVMWLMAYRYHRPSFWILSPIVFSLYVSIVYCRYHYVTDAIFGVVVALIVSAVGPTCQRWWNRIVDRKEKCGSSLPATIRPSPKEEKLRQ